MLKKLLTKNYNELSNRLNDLYEVGTPTFEKINSL